MLLKLCFHTTPVEPTEDRRGYRNGAETRRVTTSVGTRELRVPRARVRDEETGETTEFRSELLPRYARRTREVDEAILGTYLSGTNSRRIPVGSRAGAVLRRRGLSVSPRFLVGVPH